MILHIHIFLVLSDVDIIFLNETFCRYKVIMKHRYNDFMLKNIVLLIDYGKTYLTDSV